MGCGRIPGIPLNPPLSVTMMSQTPNSQLVYETIAARHLGATAGSIDKFNQFLFMFVTK